MADQRPDPALVSAAFASIEGCLGEGLAVLGVCGAQGSGKSILAGALLEFCLDRGIAAATLSLDDLYLPRSERERLARTVHPLLATRGVPGTHDVALGIAVMSALARGEPAPLPRFSKAADDRLPNSDWPRAPRGCRLLLFEGWCVGARPQGEGALREPVNALEADEDREGIWRRHANAALAGGYQQLFARIERLVLLAAPSFDVVLNWRLQQEEQLRASGGEGRGLMDAGQLARFIQHYERLTRHILCEMPARADLVVELGADRTPLTIRTAAARR